MAMWLGRNKFLGCAALGAATVLAAAMTSGADATISTFATGSPQVAMVGATGCGGNQAGEPSIHVSQANLVGISSENGLGAGSQYWRGPSSMSACGLGYSGQPNAVHGI